MKDKTKERKKKKKKCKLKKNIYAKKHSQEREKT